MNNNLMKKSFIIVILFLLLVLPAMAMATEFVVDENIVVEAVTFGGATADMIIFNGAQAESITYYDSGTFTVTNPGVFQVGSANTAVKTILVKDIGGTTISCANNSTPGTSYVTLPATAATYTIVPSATASCNSYCAAITGIATYYSVSGTFSTPTCGAAACNSGYILSGSGTGAICNAPGAIIGGGSSGGGGSATPTPTPAATTTPATITIATTTTPIITATPISYVQQWQNVLTDAAIISSGNPETILSAIGAVRNIPAEIAVAAKYTANLINGIKGLSAEAKNAITNFVVYGTPTTKKLGAGERAGVINSYKAAFGKVPVTEAEWKDAIAIGNGRWPAAKSAVAEAKAIVEFKKVYKRSPNLKQPNDNAAVTVIAYGLRPSVRNTNSEKAAIKSFKYIYGYAPKSAIDWDIVRAIAYSGAKR